MSDQLFRKLCQLRLIDKDFRIPFGKSINDMVYCSPKRNKLVVQIKTHHLISKDSINDPLGTFQALINLHEQHIAHLGIHKCDYMEDSSGNGYFTNYSQLTEINYTRGTERLAQGTERLAQGSERLAQGTPRGEFSVGDIPDNLRQYFEHIKIPKVLIEQGDYIAIDFYMWVKAYSEYLNWDYINYPIPDRETIEEVLISLNVIRSSKVEWF